jgi:pimeloyl-ACP methyl ester carboxylesterase
MADKLPVADVVVLLPGILGSVLERDGEEVWALSRGAAFRGLISLGGSVKDLQLSDDDPDVDDLGDGVRATRLMPDVHLIPGFWKIDGYGKIKDWLFDRFAFEEGVNWFDFPYDWRRDNRVAARRLAEQAPRWLAAYRQRSGKEDAKLLLVGHSMGGLVARHFLEVLGGWEETKALLTFGTPYRGSLNALDFLANGFRKGFGPFKVDLSDLLRSLTSVYQLLPTYACVDEGAGPVEIAAAERLPASVDRTKVAAAARFHADIAAAVERNGGFGRYLITPVAGIFQPTKQSAVVDDDGRVELRDDLAGDDDAGDGTVPRISATPLELSDAQREVYATESHSALQNVSSLLVQLAGLMTWEPLTPHKGSPFDGFRLDVDDLVAPDAPLDVVVSTAAPILDVAVVVEDVDTGERTEVAGAVGSDGTATVTVPPQRPGIYRVIAEDRDQTGVKSVQDLVVVADESSAERIADGAAR